MPNHHERRELPHSARQMYDLVANVGLYPEFLPWVGAVRVRSDSETEMLADMVVGFKSLKETFSSRVVKTPCNSITVDYIDGPMKYLNNRWLFEELPSGGCVVDFTVDFAFRNALFEAIAGKFFESALRKMTSAFISRANSIYGECGSNNVSA
jgi:coenzyme Q-binding protein COQ10